MQRLRKGDEVIVISGVDKGSRGPIERLVYDANRQVTHVLINGVNKRWKHSRGNPRLNDPGGRLSKEMPIPASKVALYNATKGGADRIRIVVDKDGNKERVFVSNGEKV